MSKLDQEKIAMPAHQRLTFGRKEAVVMHQRESAQVIVEHVAEHGLNCRVKIKKVSFRSHGLEMERLQKDFAELQKVVSALAVYSVAHDEPLVAVDDESLTVLHADAAYQLLDNPPEPTEALRNLLALR